MTWRQAGVLAAATVLSMLATIAGSLYLTRQPTDELRSRDGRIQRLTLGLGDCATEVACRKAFHKLDRAAKP